HRALSRHLHAPACSGRHGHGQRHPHDHRPDAGVGSVTGHAQAGDPVGVRDADQPDRIACAGQRRIRLGRAAATRRMGAGQPAIFEQGGSVMIITPTIAGLAVSIAMLAVMVAVVIGVMLARSLLVAIILMSVYSFATAVWLLMMDAADVSFTEAVVGAGV